MGFSVSSRAKRYCRNISKLSCELYPYTCPAEAVTHAHPKVGFAHAQASRGITSCSANPACPLGMAVATVTMMQALSHISSHPTLFSREQLTTTGPATPRGCWNGRLHNSRHAAPPV
ncbi:hypothetical protein CDEST_13622 [Colletotrichum destructivum]|uniref:Uncharacterized protein n=1 Tax=Colletotrichum destructivum TaxID=34406 RepID=A0AAX4IZR2_9PEZI|nr:hypothetical protein CDEST_13622 [Colletotrichum destructivum]